MVELVGNKASIHWTVNDRISMAFPDIAAGVQVNKDVASFTAIQWWVTTTESFAITMIQIEQVHMVSWKSMIGWLSCEIEFVKS